MTTPAPILIADGDDDEFAIVSDAMRELALENPLVFCKNSEEVLSYMISGKQSPFLILCDVNLPGCGGFALKKILLDDVTLNHGSIPFIFWSTAASKQQIQEAYDLSVHGFFIKDHSFSELKESLLRIVEYWAKSKTPANT